ncbi:RNA-binding protein EIF1AD isoform X2 [Apis mellifera caucasica]|nr:probable RNA-binding protein EIF1AD isoform X2 [Apis mellifera]KAG6803366.1 RNA-binding protein EIF1AD isoform X2 [Apis mellifera caucasica]KAG9435328.1 RNA-binding protein EIF1AD isoform X2 [Apis mellifera carnica]|eukprot:XP_001120246.1 probable RNA-binding protein EIF1AD isoform X2 [Apis mellifera]
MSKASKRKYIVKEIEDFSIPTESQSIVRIVKSCGNNLHEVIDPAGIQYLISMPVKFRKNIWIKQGDFVLVEPIPEGAKVKAEIVKILTREHKKWYREQNCWPQEFDEVSNSKQRTIKEDSDNEEDDLFINNNRNRLFQNRIDNTSNISSEESDSC